MGDTAEPSVARFDLLLAHADSVFCVLEPAGTLLFVSDSARRVLGVDAGDLVGCAARCARGDAPQRGLAA